VTGVASKPYRARAVESALEGKQASAESIAAAAAHAADGVEALADLHASAEYRTHVAAVYVRRALEAAAGQAR
jgi:carbon-monoxide dehydrogenase medium subunit